MHRPITKKDVSEGLEYAFKRTQDFVNYEFVHYDDYVSVSLFDVKGRESSFAIGLDTAECNMYGVGRKQWEVVERFVRDFVAYLDSVLFDDYVLDDHSEKQNNASANIEAPQAASAADE